MVRNHLMSLLSSPNIAFLLKNQQCILNDTGLPCYWAWRSRPEVFPHRLADGPNHAASPVPERSLRVHLLRTGPRAWEQVALPLCMAQGRSRQEPDNTDWIQHWVLPGRKRTGLMGQKRKEMLRNKEMNGAHVRRDASTSSPAQGPCLLYCFPQSPLGDTENSLAQWQKKGSGVWQTLVWTPALQFLLGFGPSSIGAKLHTHWNEPICCGAEREMLHCRTHRRCSVMVPVVICTIRMIEINIKKYL